LIKILIVSLVL